MTTVRHEHAKDTHLMHRIGAASRFVQVLRAYPYTTLYLAVMSTITSVAAVLETVPH